MTVCSAGEHCFVYTLILVVLPSILIGRVERSDCFPSDCNAYNSPHKAVRVDWIGMARTIYEANK